MRDPKKELEQFAYIVSHDLNAPLRHIKSFGSLLFDSLGDKVDAQEREYMDYMNKGVVKLEGMVEALLNYSRVATRTNELGTFDCSALVQDAMAELQADIEQTGAQVVFVGLPSKLRVDGLQMRKLFYHLLDNALKYRSADIAPEIKVSAEAAVDNWVFKIEDNGVGIPENLYENAFRMFYRLDPQDGVDGQGVGLTLAQKIVERHDGEIWLSVPESGTGTLVSFSMPLSA